VAKLYTHIRHPISLLL